MNLPSGPGVVVSAWISSVVVTVQRREEGPWEVFFYYDTNLHKGSGVVLSTSSVIVTAQKKDYSYDRSIT